MSDGPRIPRKDAVYVADHLIERWGLGVSDTMKVGSIRRKKIDVGDIELVTSLPVGFMAADTLYERMHEDLWMASGDERPDPGTRIGTVISGLKPGFLSARAMVKVTLKSGAVRIPVEVFRYEPGPEGNRGWVETLRTGHKDCIQVLLARWKQVHGLAAEAHASERGFLRDHLGRKVPTPSERDVWMKARVQWVEPEHRIDARSLRFI